MKKRMIVAALSLVAAGAFFACEKVDVNSQIAKPEEAAAQVPEEAAILTESPAAVATIVVGSTPFSVEIAQTDEEKAKGLMNREALAANSGMWFIFAQMGSEKFWMKNTLIPLDLIFVDDKMKVVHVIENAEPQSTKELSSPAPFQYVLEVSGGASAKAGIKVGDAVKKQIGPQ